MKLALYSPCTMTGEPLTDDAAGRALAASWARFDLLILSLPSLMRNRWMLPLVRRECPNSTVMGYVDLMTACPWLAGADGEAAMQREPDTMTTKQRRIGQGFDAIRGDYIDITVPGVAHALMTMIADAALALDRLPLYFDSFFPMCPFPADSATHAKWFSTASWMAGIARSLCHSTDPFVTNPSWFHYGSFRMSERWPDLEAVDPIQSFMAGPSKHEGGLIFCGFDPNLLWPSPEEQERRVRYAAGCALVLDAHLCVGPTDLNWKQYGRYWEWFWDVMDLDLGKRLSGPFRDRGDWISVYEMGSVRVNVEDQTTDIVT